MKKVLIVSYEYPPLNNIAARRFSQLIPYLKDLGWEAYILTTQSTGDLPCNLPECNIFRITTHPESLNGLDNNSKAKPLLPLYQFRKKLNLRFDSLDNSIVRWFIPVLKSNVITEIKKLDINFVIASYRTPAALMIGKKIASEIDVPWIADFRDLGALYKDKYSIKPFIIEQVDKVHENHIIKSASAITTVSKTLAELLKSNYKKETTVIYNGWVQNDYSGNIDSSADVFTSNTPYIYYAGRFYEHRMQAMYLLIEAIKDIDVLLVIRSLGPEECEDKLSNYAQSKGISNKIIILPRTTQNIIDAEQFDSALNLVVEDLDKNYEMQKGVLTGKLMQLLTYPPQILAIARDDSEIGEVLTNTSKGKLLTNPKDIKDYITFVTKNNNLKSLSFEKIKIYSKETQAKKLVSLMNSIHNQRKIESY